MNSYQTLCPSTFQQGNRGNQSLTDVKASEMLIVGSLLSFPLCLQTESLKIFDHVRLQLVFRVIVPAGERQGFRGRRCPFWNIKKLLKKACVTETQRQRDRGRRAQLSFTPTADYTESKHMADTVALWAGF